MLGRVRERGERFLEEISAEYHAASAGHKPDALLQPIYAKHREAFGEEAFATVHAQYRSTAAASEEHRSARLLLDWLIEEALGRREHIVEDALLDAMTGKIEEADRLGNPPQFRAKPRPGASLALKERGDVENRDLLG
mgnify:CR=1 FL=1